MTLVLFDVLSTASLFCLVSSRSVDHLPVYRVILSSVVRLMVAHLSYIHRIVHGSTHPSHAPLTPLKYHTPRTLLVKPPPCGQHDQSPVTDKLYPYLLLKPKRTECLNYSIVVVSHKSSFCQCTSFINARSPRPCRGHPQVV